MNKDKRLKLIKSIAAGRKTKARKEHVAADRDSGLIVPPTFQDIDEELSYLSGFRGAVKPTEAEEMFYGVSESFSSDEE